MAKNGCTHIPAVKMTMPKDDRRDAQFHLDILKKNNQQATKRPK